MIKREDYLHKLVNLRDTQVIKIITGIRRSGKSVLMNQFRDYLLENGVSSSNIIFINFELLEYEYLKDYKKLYEYIIDNTKDGKMYIMIDEVQEVDKFEKVVDSLFAKGNYDIYLTGSNSRLLSSEISTLLSGRYIEIPILPFSFKEYYELVGGDKRTAFNEYYKYGGLPGACQIKDRDLKLSCIEGIYNTIVIKDLIDRKRIADVSLLKDIVKFLLDTVGNSISAKKISDTLTSYGRKTTHVAIGNYIDAL